MTTILIWGILSSPNQQIINLISRH